MANRKTNRILHDYGDGTILIDISTPKYPNATSKMDAVDFERSTGRICLGRGEYPQIIHHGKTVVVHRIIFPDWKSTDHINRNRADNRRCNLRQCTRSQNAINCSARSNNTSGAIGVTWNKANTNWRARIKINRTQISLGCFVIKEDAIAVRRQAEKHYFGEFAPIRQATA